MLRKLSLAIGLLSATTLLAEEHVDFNFDVKPILSDRCFVCHGPDEADREADLRLDTREGLFKESDTGNVERIVSPGRPDQSELWLRVHADDPDVMMPPPTSKLELNQREKQLLGAWIRQGAPWKGHWSVQPFRKDSRKQLSVTDAIDRFIGDQLTQAGFQPSGPASKEQLLRRVSFDITGLPPTLQELDEFLEDSSDHAYETVVDRLLASVAFGERMAAQWLDVARYSDTYGYQVDRDRFVWPYRDWVIRAFNRNLPYDEFLIEQLAGDLLPHASQDQILATTFNRLHPQKVEGGSVPEEFRIEYVADRTQTFATSMLGLTLECARCHDHKYDPILQKEYYQLTAFFDKIDEAGLYSYFTPSVPTPTLLLGKDQARRQLEPLQQQVRREEERLAALRVELIEMLANGRSEPIPLAELPGQLEHLTFEDLPRDGPNQPVPGVRGSAVKLSGDDGISLKSGNFQRHDPFSIALWLQVPKRRERAVVFHRSRAWTDAGSRGYQLLIEDGRLSFSLIHFWPGNAIRVKSKDELATKHWHHVAVTYDGSSRADGVRLFLNGAPMATEVVRDNLYKHITGGGGDHITIGQRFRDMGLTGGLVDEFRVFDRQLDTAEAKQLFHDGQQQSSTAANQAATDAKLPELLLLRHEDYKQQLEVLREARKRYNERMEAFEEIMVMGPMSHPRQTHLLKRGAYDAPGEPVDADTPAWLPPLDDELPRNRLGLARWLTHDEHPLTARVVVNRLWQLLFGEGLVRTPEDFGSQGQLPTHPELLDWLARDFIEHHWDTKRLIKQIVTSHTYRQSSMASAEMLRRDPENRLYGRAPSYRWPAEMLRDQALLAGGLLVSKLGGPPAKPYELEVSFKPTKPDEGEGLYRRSLYTYWKRTGPAPVMMALDAAKRDVCRVQRSRTSSPLQTLVLMNSPQFVEAARGLAEQVLRRHEQTDAQLAAIFRTLTARSPAAAELAVLQQLHAEMRERFRQDADAAKAYLQVGQQQVEDPQATPQLAALASVANMLLGFDECMMKY